MFSFYLLLICPVLVVLAIIINWRFICQYLALRKLLKWYSIPALLNKYKTVGDLKRGERYRHCPLCVVNSGNCKKCIWVKKTGKNCMGCGYSEMLLVDRIEQIKQWMKEMRKELK